MGSALMNTIGLVGDGLGIVSFFTDLLPDAPVDQGTTVSIKVGRNEKDDPGMGGKIAATYAWDIDNVYLGKGDGTDLGSGDYKDITVGQDSPGAQAEYVGVAVDNDAVCIAWISVKQFDNTEGGAWTGDIGYNCGQNWYEQNQRAGKIKDTENDYIPKCTWLDGDHSEGVPSAALKFYIRAYGEEVTDTANNNAGCSKTAWGPDNGPINAKPSKRANRERLPWMQESLVVSNITSHRAENLCNSATSWGPDFVGTDGYFCDMETKTLTPLCSTKRVPGCLDIDQESNQVKKRSFVAKREVQTTHKTYKKIDNWE